MKNIKGKKKLDCSNSQDLLLMKEKDKFRLILLSFNNKGKIQLIEIMKYRNL